MSILRPYPPLANNCSLQSATPETKKRLALAIIDFLSTSLKDGTVTSEDAESIEIAQTCIADIFHVDPKDKAAIQDAIGGQSLLSIYGVYERLKLKPSSTSPASKPAAPTPASPEAESLKSQGNAAMQRKDYETAIKLYSQAIEISPLNPIYLSNRAAAYSASGMHADAQEDAETAVAADPHYTKAWSRLGLARFVLGDAKGSMEAYEKGIEYEGNGGSEAMKKGYKTAKEKVEEEKNEVVEDQAAESARNGPGGGAEGGMPDLSALAGLMGGGAGGGGAPDLASIMSNPMFASMARNLISNPNAMNNIMSNPQVRQMAEQFGFGGAGGGAGGGTGGGAGGGAGDGAGAAGSGAGGMPDLASMMNDPNIAEMARNFMGGGGRGAGRGA